jgi:hypothetical protein
MKKLGKIFLIITPWIVLACLGGLYLQSRVFYFPWVWEEKGRKADPSGKCEVVTYEGNRGAMSSFAYVCYLVKPGQKLDPNACDFYEPILSSSHTLPKLRWADSHRLVINPEGGYVNHERPYSREFQVAVEIEGEISKQIE